MRGSTSFSILGALVIVVVVTLLPAGQVEGRPTPSPDPNPNPHPLLSSLKGAWLGHGQKQPTVTQSEDGQFVIDNKIVLPPLSAQEAVDVEKQVKPKASKKGHHDGGGGGGGGHGGGSSGGHGDGGGGH